VCPARNRTETEAQSHSDVGRKWLGIETLQHYKEHHTAREYNSSEKQSIFNYTSHKIYTAL
jgi:hypothetical protein